MTTTAPIYTRPVELLQRLIRFNTTNPPGNEAECIAYINRLLNEAGIPTTILARDPARPNLIARLEGQGHRPPLLLHGHVDVVTTANQDWQHPPFAGKLVDGYVWGRGALDMKSGVAMMLAALLRAKAEQTPLPGDVVLAIMSDEEAGSDYGAKFLVEQHADLFRHIRYAISEFGGFTLQIGSQRFYPIIVAEKQICWMRVLLRGPGGHGSMPIRNGAMARLGQVLLRLNTTRLPVHITSVTRRFIELISQPQPLPMRLLLGQLLNPALTDRIIDQLGMRANAFDAMLHHTVSATIVRGGEKVNVIPSEIELQLDGRILPGFSPADLVAELRALIGADIELEVLRYDPGPPEPDMGMFGTLASILREADPQGIPVPMLGVGVTDGRFFARLGIQTYGYLPMILPEEMNFTRLIHAADERIPVEAVHFGTAAIYQAIQR